MKIVLDTNVLMSGIFFGGAPARILKAWGDGRLKLAMSTEIIDEYLATAEVLTERYGPTSMETILGLIVGTSEVCKSRALPEPVCSDPDDDKFLACAKACKADYVVSGDKALRRTSGYENILVVSPRQFVDDTLRTPP